MSRFEKNIFDRFDCIFEAQKHDCNKKRNFGCPEETSPYLRKPFPRKILYLNPLTHIWALITATRSTLARNHPRTRAHELWHPRHQLVRLYHSCPRCQWYQHLKFLKERAVPSAFLANFGRPAKSVCVCVCPRYFPDTVSNKVHFGTLILRMKSHVLKFEVVTVRRARL